MARWWRIVPPVLLAAAGAAVLLVTGWPTVDGIRSVTASAGWAAPLVFTLLFAAFTLVPAPATIMGIAAGVLFGLPVGLATTMAGAAAGALAGFAISRVLGRGLVSGLGGDRFRRLDERLVRDGLWTVAGGRLLPLVPFPLLSYAAGLTAIRARDYLAGTVLGVLPSAVVFVTIGAYGADPGRWQFLLAVAGLLVLAAGMVVARRRARSTAAA